MNSGSRTAEAKPMRFILRNRNLQLAFGATLMAVIGVTSITPAFPKIIEQLNIAPQEVGLLISVFTAPMVVLTIFLGVLGDRISRKMIIAPSLLLFGIAGVGCSLAQDFNTLLIMRFFQGIGCAALFPLAIANIYDMYSGEELTAAMGYNTSINQIGHTLFPAIGGGLAMFGWNYPFLIPILAVPIGLVTLFSTEPRRSDNNQNMRQYLGMAFGSMKNWKVLGIFTISALMFVIVYGAYLTYLPILLADYFGATSFVIGLIVLVMYVSSATTSSQVAKLARILPGRKLLIVAFILFIPALAYIPLAPSIWAIIPAIAVMGVSWGISVPGVYAVLAELAPPSCRAAFVSMDELAVRIGQTLGPIFMVLAFGAYGIIGVFYVAIGFALAMLAIASTILK